jgi:hypothetical protein
MGFFWNQVDPAIVANAPAWKLDTADGRRAFLEMLLVDPRGRPGLTRILFSWLQLETTRPSEEVPDALWRLLLEEASRFMFSALFGPGNPSADARALFAPSDAIVNGALASHYGLPAAGAEWVARPLPPEERAGLFRLGAILAAHPSAPGRGAFIFRSTVGCYAVPEPIGFPHPDPATTTLSRRAVEAALSVNPVCATSCHMLTSSGFGLQAFDELGRHRAVDGDGSPIDAHGFLSRDAQETIAFDGAPELAAVLGQKGDTGKCLTLAVLAFAAKEAGLIERPTPSCVPAGQHYARYPLMTLLQDIVTALATDPVL